MFDFLKKKGQPENLKEVLKYCKGLEKRIDKLEKNLENLQKESKFSVQGVGIVRYNPFSDVGGNQSFSLALLDANNDGLIITSIYARDDNRIYAKPIKKGASEYSLSDEEKKAIEKATTKI